MSQNSSDNQNLNAKKEVKGTNSIVNEDIKNSTDPIDIYVLRLNLDPGTRKGSEGYGPTAVGPGPGPRPLPRPVGAPFEWSN